MLPARLPTIRTTHWRLRKSALIVSGRGWPSSTTIRLGVSVLQLRFRTASELAAWWFYLGA